VVYGQRRLSLEKYFPERQCRQAARSEAVVTGRKFGVYHPVADGRLLLRLAAQGGQTRVRPEEDQQRSQRGSRVAAISCEVGVGRELTNLNCFKSLVALTYFMIRKSFLSQSESRFAMFVVGAPTSLSNSKRPNRAMYIIFMRHFADTNDNSYLASPFAQVRLRYLAVSLACPLSGSKLFMLFFFVAGGGPIWGAPICTNSTRVFGVFFADVIVFDEHGKWVFRFDDERRVGWLGALPGRILLRSRKPSRIRPQIRACRTLLP
jgi:hypothetical protein